jgi:hypothetical protein
MSSASAERFDAVAALTNELWRYRFAATTQTKRVLDAMSVVRSRRAGTAADGRFNPPLDPTEPNRRMGRPVGPCWASSE